MTLAMLDGVSVPTVYCSQWREEAEMTNFEFLHLAIASENDARTTALVLQTHPERPEHVTLVHVVEKAGGTSDKAGVEQRSGGTETNFSRFHTAFDDDATVSTQLVYDTDVAEGNLHAAGEFDDDAIVFVPREGGLFARLHTCDGTRQLVDRTDRPVLALPQTD